MGEKMKKNSSLTIRIDCKTKKDLKEIAKNKGLTMSELANECLTELVEQEIFKKQHQEQLESRTKYFEKKLNSLKDKMNW